MDKQEGDKVQVILAAMPFAPATHPSPALGCLAAALKRQKISVECLYPALDFAKRIGMAPYQTITGFHAQVLLGEWIFAEAAFHQSPRDEEYLDHFFPGRDHAGFYRLRKKAGEFVNQWADIIAEKKPGIVGCTSMFCQNCASLALLRRIRERAPEIATIMGGANCESFMGSELHANFGWVDYVFSGESDHSFPDLCGRILQGEQPGREGRRFSPYILTPYDRQEKERPFLESEQVEDLNELPVPDFTDYFNALLKEGLQNAIRPGILAETSRGCWWGNKSPCSFCGLNGDAHQFRCKSPDRVYEEMTDIAARYGIGTIQLTDNVMNPAYCSSVMPRFSGQGIHFLYEVRASLSKEQIQQLREAGVLWVQAGIEHLHDESLKLLNKGTTAIQNLRFLKWCRQYGISVIWNHLTDIPMEKDRWCLENAERIPLLHHLMPPGSALNPIRFDRFSCYYHHPEAYGLKLSAAAAYSYVYMDLPPESLDRIAYFFENTAEDIHRQRGSGQLLMVQRLQEWIDRYHDEYRASMKKGEAVYEPSLCIYESGSSAYVIYDHRLMAKREVYRLEGMEALIYNICDAGAGMKEILNLLQESGRISIQETEAILKSFIQAGLMLQIGDQYLSLAVNGPVLPAASPYDVPGGGLRKIPPPLPDPSQLTVEDMFQCIFKG